MGIGVSGSTCQGYMNYLFSVLKERRKQKMQAKQYTQKKNIKNLSPTHSPSTTFKKAQAKKPTH
jgi:hypothetical protein